MPGRPRKPFALHVAQGTDRSRVKKQTAEAYKPTAGDVGECPTWICPEGKTEWERLTQDPDYSRCLSPVMRGALIDYCNLYGRMIRTETGMPRWFQGAEITGVSEVLTASERNSMHSLRMQLGLTPAAAGRLQAPAAATKEDAWSKLG